MIDFSYIFTYRQPAQDRYDDMCKTLDWLNTVPGNFECIIVEQDSSKKLELPDKDYKFSINHLWVFNDGLFNRSWGFNIATNIAQSDYLFFADSDMVVPQKSITECVDMMKNGFESVKPFHKLIDLNKVNTDTVDVTIPIETLELKKTDRNPLRGGWGYGSGIVAYTKPALKRIYGWDERFKGWGGEDDIQWQKTKQLLRHKMLKYNCYHLYHTRGPNNGTNRHSNYKNNLNLYWRYHRNPKLILKEMVGQNKSNPNQYKKS